MVQETQGPAFTAALDHYEEVPSHIAEKVIDAHKKDATAGEH